MLPILISVGPVKIYTFGVFLVLAFFWGSFLLWKNIRLTQYKEEDIFDGVIIGLFSGLFLGRLVYVLLNFSDFGLNILKFILLNGYPGVSLVGAMLGGFLSLYLFFSYKKIDFFEVVDYFISPLFLAFAFAKLGGFFSGTEVGTVTNFFLKIKYTGFAGTRHLTAFYESVLFFLAAYAAYKLLFEVRKEKFKKNFLAVIFVWFFSLIYFSFDNLKENHLYLASFSFNKMASAVLLLTSSLYFVYYFKSKILFFFRKYGQKAFKKIYFGTKGKTHAGKGKNPKTSN